MPADLGAMPNFVVALSGANKVATRSAQEALQLGREIRPGRRKKAD